MEPENGTLEKVISNLETIFFWFHVKLGPVNPVNRASKPTYLLGVRLINVRNVLYGSVFLRTKLKSKYYW